MSRVLSTRCWKCMKKFNDTEDKYHVPNKTTGEDFVCKSCYDKKETNL